MTAATPSYRALEWNDFDTVCALRLSRYDEVEKDPDYGMVSNAKRPTRGELPIWFAGRYQKMLDGELVCSVAAFEGRVIGMATASAEGPSVETRHVGVVGIEVISPWRGQGVGTALLAHLLEACRGTFQRVNLSVIPVNARAKRVYEKLGFTQFGVAPAAFQRAGRSHDFILMTRAIEPPTPATSGKVPLHRHSL